MKSIIKTILTGTVAFSLAACSGTPNCESKEASNWFKDNLSPQLNQLINTLASHAPAFYVLDDVETVKHNKEADAYNCKGVARLHLSNDENKMFASFDDVSKKDSSFAQIVENELIAKGSKDNALFPVLLLSFTPILNASLRANDANPKDIKYHLDIPVEYSIRKIKSSGEKFQIATDLQTDEVNQVIAAHSILLSRLAIAKNFLDHPELLTKIKADNAAIEAKNEKDKQDASDKEKAAAEALKAEREAIKEEKIAEKQAADEERQKLIQEQEALRQKQLAELRAMEEKKNAERLEKLKVKQEEQLKRQKAITDQEEAYKKSREDFLNSGKTRKPPVNNLNN